MIAIARIVPVRRGGRAADPLQVVTAIETSTSAAVATREAAIELRLEIVIEALANLLSTERPRLDVAERNLDVEDIKLVRNADEARSANRCWE